MEEGGACCKSAALDLDDLACSSPVSDAGVAGAAFFWSFEVLVFLVLLNFLLAIIVDAFAEARGRAWTTRRASWLPPTTPKPCTAPHA